MFDYCVIMAGGSGTRLWPASNSKRPKQFLSIEKDGSRSFFSDAVERALALANDKTGRVIVIAGDSHIPRVIETCAALGAACKKRLVLIPEPEAKNTAAAIACAVAFAASEDAGGVTRTMMVLTSDHVIQPLHVLRDNAETAAGFAVRDRLVVFGVPPTRPETGYGYIETGTRLGEGVYAVAAFREKPDPQSAKRFAASKRFFWNSGMFAFSAGFMAGRFRALAPEVFGPFAQLTAPSPDAWTLKKGLRILNAWEGLAAAYRKTKSISFDYAVAEKCAESVCIRAAFDWIDVGNWEEYAKLRGDTGAELYRSGAGEESCFVDSDIPVALAGVEDLIVVIRSGKDGSAPVALVTRKGRTQGVREVVEAIKQSGKTALL